MANLFSDIVSNDALWGNPNADYATLLGVVGGAANRDRIITKTALVASAVNTPIACLFILGSDLDHVYVGHSPSNLSLIHI